ncbi:hypothetical protein FQN55_003402 [Onygenales sp. PD_40]|nr:hypothetical protein FQN55_003402 [Onygenales sp. PD_40]KAK2773872.1 hypothetical protein FQN53_003926 [Emmonsiellopsis sp. PD_33]KAK2795148.1 hypothetical protein FQN52_006074 [Onygenales sp. PD_12]KAK2807569.1 hypothetical protein FQN51_000002 [Onygenales sp. PD_10]
MPPTPQSTDFPPSLTLTITPPPPPNPRSTNILLILHGLGDTTAPYASFASAMRLPETTCIALQAPTPLPFELPGYHWGDDIMFDPDKLDVDPGFTRATRKIVEELILQVLMQKLGYRSREILIFGYGQGASVGLSVAMEVARGALGDANKELGGVVAVGGVVPLSAIREDGRVGKAPTPVLLVGGRGPESALSEAGEARTKNIFGDVEVVRWAGRRGDGMPGNREEMFPIMRFLARRLRSRAGVPEGSVEVS